MEAMPDEVTDLLNESDADADFAAAEWERHRAAHEDNFTCDCADGREEFDR